MYDIINICQTYKSKCIIFYVINFFITSHTIYLDIDIIYVCLTHTTSITYNILHLLNILYT